MRANVRRILIVCNSPMLGATLAVEKDVAKNLKSGLGNFGKKSSSLVEAGPGRGGCLLPYSCASFVCARGSYVPAISRV